MPIDMSSSRPAALSRGPIVKPRSAAVSVGHRAFADLEQRANARHRAPGADAPDALRHQHAIVHVERHEIGDRAERDEVEEIRDRRHDHRAARIDFAAHGGHHVERDADAGERARTEACCRAHWDSR